MLVNNKTGTVDGFENILPLPDINSMYTGIPAKLLDLLIKAKKHPAEIMVRTDMMFQLLNKMLTKTDIKLRLSPNLKLIDEVREALINNG